MQHYWSLEGVQLQKSWLTIGSFDGVHLGHQEIIRQLVGEAHSRGSLAVALTFFPHPALVLGKRNEPYYLTTPQQRAEILGDSGVDVVITYPFELETAQLSAREFISLIHRHLQFEGLCVGHDFALGKNREGNMEKLTRLGEEYGYQVKLIEPVTNGDMIVSSSRIRAKILAGEIERAGQLLGRYYRIKGKVVPGDGRGKTIGIPTANLETWAEQAIPKSGVYAGRIKVRTQDYGAVINIGVRPTFELSEVLPRVEAHILDFQGEIYGEEIALDFISRLRDERRFENIESLVGQIQLDISRAKQLLAVY